MASAQETLGRAGLPVIGELHDSHARGDCVPSDGDSQRTDESRRILARVSGEAEPGGAAPHRIAGETPDPIEKLGTRIARALSIAITVAVIVWVVIYFLRSA
jgi:hypothetical protein